MAVQDKAAATEKKAAGLEQKLLTAEVETVALRKNMSVLEDTVADLRRQRAEEATAKDAPSPATTSGDLQIDIASEDTVKIWAAHFKDTVTHAGALTLTCSASQGTKPCDQGRVSAILGNLKSVLGTLTVTGGVAGALELPRLEQVGGLGVTSTSLATVSLPRLEQVGGELSISSSSLATVSLPRLERVGGNFGFSQGGGTTLTGISVPSLTSIGGRFSVYRAYGLATLTTTNLATVGGERTAPPARPRQRQRHAAASGPHRQLWFFVWPAPCCAGPTGTPPSSRRPARCRARCRARPIPPVFQAWPALLRGGHVS